jgi:hypothetical protein
MYQVYIRIVRELIGLADPVSGLSQDSGPRRRRRRSLYERRLETRESLRELLRYVPREVAQFAFIDHAYTIVNTIALLSKNSIPSSGVA